MTETSPRQDLNVNRYREPPPPEYSLRDFLTILFKYKATIVFFFATVVVVVGMWTFLAAPTYEVKAAILVKKSRAEIPLTPTQSTQLIIDQVTEEDLNSEIEILKSRSLIEEVIAKLPPQESQEPVNFLQTMTARFSELIEDINEEDLSNSEKLFLSMERKLDVQALRRSNVIEISYRSQDPVWATEFVRALVDHYLQRRIQIYQVPWAVSFFEEETSTAKHRLLEAENSLQDYIAVAGISLPIDAQKQTVLQRLGQFERELSEAQVAVRQAEDTVTALQSGLRQEPERLQSANRFNLDPEVEEIQRGLVALRLRHNALIQDFGPDNRKVRDLESQITLAEEQLGTAEDRIGIINRTEINTVHQDLKTRLLAAESDLEGARARYASLKVHVERFRPELENLNQKSFELERLQREIQTAEETYLLYSRKHEEAGISAAMDRQKMVNVSIVQEAEAPLKPIAPKRLLNMALALVLGSLGGLGVAFTRQYFDHTFTTGEDLERRLGIRHLASIPAVKKKLLAGR